MLGVTVETVRRWKPGRLGWSGRAAASASSIAEVTQAARRASAPSNDRSSRVQLGSLPGVVTRSSATGSPPSWRSSPGHASHRQLMTAEAVDELALAIGDEAVGVVRPRA
jgi:hypothetical protein